MLQVLGGADFEIPISVSDLTNDINDISNFVQGLVNPQGNAP